MAKRVHLRPILAVIAVAAYGLLGGCGQRGPLYLPAPVARPAQAPANAAPAPADRTTEPKRSP